MNLFTIKQENLPIVKKSKSGRRLVKTKFVSFDSKIDNSSLELRDENLNKNPNNETISKHKKIIKERKPPLTNSIPSISQRIQDLKKELSKLREERLQGSKKHSEDEIIENEISEKGDSSGENSNSTPDSKVVTAEEIRVRYKEALGMVRKMAILF